MGGKEAGGEGEYLWPDGGKYTGVYWDGKPHGYATRIFASGAVYVGEWQAGVMHGAGTYTHACLRIAYAYAYAYAYLSCVFPRVAGTYSYTSSSYTRP